MGPTHCSYIKGKWRNTGWAILLRYEQLIYSRALSGWLCPNSQGKWAAIMSISDAVAYCGQHLIAVSVSIAIIQIVFVGARFYTRYLQQGAYWLDDYLIVPALVDTTGKSNLWLNWSLLQFLQIASVGQAALYIYREHDVSSSSGHDKIYSP